MRRTAAPLLVAAATAFVFWSSTHNSSVSVDDPEFLIRPYRGLDAASIRGIFTHFYFSNYAPLSLLSLSADRALWGMEPFGYHLTNLLLHAANAVVFYFLCLELFFLGGKTDNDGPAAAAAALFFSLHPLRVESVAWISERRDVLCGLFFLLTLLCWMRSLRPGRLSGGPGRAAALGAFFLALLSKSAAVPLPLVLILIDLWPLRRRLRWKEKLPFLALSAVFAAVAVAAQGDAIVSLEHAVPLQRANQIWMGLVFYLGKLIWPANLTFYEWHWRPVRAAVLLGAAATAAVLAVAAGSRRLRAPLLCALAYQSVMLAPVLGFITIGHELFADRYSYLSGLAWAILFGSGLRHLARRRRAVSLIFACALLASFAAATRAQIRVWEDSLAFWKQVVRVDPETTTRPILAQVLIARGRVGEAILYLEEHLRVYPQDLKSRRALDELVVKTGTTARDHAGFHEKLGIEFAARGEFEKAAWHFERGLRYDPGSDKLRAELARARLGSKPRWRWPSL